MSPLAVKGETVSESKEAIHLRTNSARSAPTYSLANRRCCWRGREIKRFKLGTLQLQAPHIATSIIYHKSQNGTFWAHCRSSDGCSIGQRVCGSDGCVASDVLVVRCVRRQAQVHGEQGLRFDIRRRKLPWLWQLDGEGAHAVTPIVLVEVALLSAPNNGSTCHPYVPTSSCQL
jgi:hypothetical protein